MRKIIYYTSILIIFGVLVAGIDNYFGPEIRSFSTGLFLVWSAQVITRNWKEIKEFIKILYNLDNK